MLAFLSVLTRILAVIAGFSDGEGSMNKTFSKGETNVCGHTYTCVYSRIMNKLKTVFLCRGLMLQRRCGA